jgi:ABC-type multidrug transport system ATPase subunit
MKQRLGIAAPRSCSCRRANNRLDPAGINEIRQVLHERGRPRTVLVSHILSELEHICD